ncbi:hypothetical protein BIV57_06955 [Mangrovactinospora gilvigrisea]|uniref:Phosphatidic acid phosphatase type 2/haloperoxidase domain-containing protein n=1 Tax=Mangrovactinospora gilvigrisea TaxID=1428644 RepID=A0A1J7C9H8_9ACTN|nr:phosphatase PAP2 family protein [Mangrovactinospora gilvigrisea]OIV38180.1 hypothetical protein BIV57_06955 [Mangrovactinospora gilvigrisea]
MNNGQPVVELAFNPPVFSVDWYRDVTSFAASTPGWVQSLADLFTDAGLLLFVVLFCLGWWRARRGDARAMTLALVAPVATVVAYLVNSVVKDEFREVRPCRALAHAAHIAACPAANDWSFPSNHATIAAAAAAAIAVAWRQLAVLSLPIAALMAFSRVFVGVHYPHDVMAGFVEGAVVAAVASLLLTRLLTGTVARCRGVPALRPALSARRPAHARA